VPCLLAGVVGSLVLYGQAYRDEFGRIPAVGGATVQVEWGGCVWLSWQRSSARSVPPSCWRDDPAGGPQYTLTCTWS
jgi:hypothetical protein